MKKQTAKKQTLILMALLGLLTAGQAQAQVSANVVIGTPPPAIREEVVPPSPGPRWVWQAGSWRWRHGQYVWVAGHWVRAPHRGAVWVPPQYVPSGAGWAYVPGHWQ